MFVEKREFPPKKLAFMSPNSASNFLSLLLDLKRCPTTIVCGAGLSASVGLPTWVNLLKKLSFSFFEHWDFDIRHHRNNVTYESPPKNLSIAFTRGLGFYELYQNISYLAEENTESKQAYELLKSQLDVVINPELPSMMEKFTDNDALLVAQLIKNCIKVRDWNYLLRKSLYQSYEHTEFNPVKSKLIYSLIELLKSFELKTDAILNFNYDNFFELFLKEDNINCCAIFNENKCPPSGCIPIYHPHGYIPFHGGPVSKIILAESEYQQEALNPHSWSNFIQTVCFNRAVCVFVGSSMKDPNLRRLLRMNNSLRKTTHYAFLDTSPIKDKTQQMYESLFDYDLRTLGVKVIRYERHDNSKEPHHQLTETIHLLKMALEDKEYIWA